MNKVKLILLASAAAMLIGTGDADARVQFYAGSAPTLCMPTRTVAVGHALSPYAVATRLSARRYKVQSMHRHGAAYAVRAIGPHGNKVDMMVDGGSGTIIGLTVLAATAGNVISALTAQNAVYVDDLHPFGAVVPEVVYNSWDNVDESSWQVASAETIAVQESYAAYRSAVPFNFVHFGRNGRSFALAPPKYRGFRLANSRGQSMRLPPMSRSDRANEEAAYQSERADQADFDKQMAQEDAQDANERADNLQDQNDALSDEADRQSQRADEAEQKNAELQQQLDKDGTADQDVRDDQADDDNGGSTDADSNDSGGSTDADSNDSSGNTTDATTSSDNGGSSDQDSASTTDNGGAAADQNAASASDTGGAQADSAQPTGPEGQPDSAAASDQGGDSNVDRNYSTGDDQGGAETNTAEDRVPANTDSATPDDQGGAEQGAAAAPDNQAGVPDPSADPATSVDQGGADQGGAQPDASPQDDSGAQPDEAQPDQGGADQGGAQPDAAPQDDSGAQPDEAQPDQGGGGDQGMDQGGGGDDSGGGDMDSGGGGDDSGGGGGDDGD